MDMIKFSSIKDKKVIIVFGNKEKRMKVIAQLDYRAISMKN